MALVLLTREADRCAETARRLSAAGHEAVVLPLMRHRDLGNAIPEGPFDAVALTSAAAIHVLAARREGVTELAALPAYCVGGATAAAARAAGFLQIRSADGDAGDLAALIAGANSVRRLLYLAPRQRAFDLPAALRGIAVTIVEIYEAEFVEPGADALAEALAKADAVFLYSPRSAAHFAETALRAGTGEALRGLTFVAISEKTAHTARERLGVPVLVASEPEERAMIALL